VDGHGVTRHGFALNVAPDMQYWQGIIPCGLEGVRMTCLAELMSDPPCVREVGVRCAQAMGDVLGYRVVFTQ
jgi:lipoate-protein ligase B